MDPRLVIPDAPRAGVPPGLADLPLFTLAWRALKAEASATLKNSSRIAQAEEVRSQEKKRRQALLALANEIFRLQKVSLSGAASTVIERIEQALLDLGVEIVAPVGEVYSEGLMEVLDNLAQQPTAGLDQARVHEVIVPTILIDGEIAQIGKAVIAVPESGKSGLQSGRLPFMEPGDAPAQDRRWIDQIKQMSAEQDQLRKFLDEDSNEKSGGEDG